MEKRGKKLILMSIFLVLVILITTSLVSADLFKWFKETITGRASSQSQSVSVTISGVNQAVIELVGPIGNINPQEKQSVTIFFNVTVYDPDGVADINDSSVNATFWVGGDKVSRRSSTCPHLVDLDAYRANYTCNITMWYFDQNQVYNVSVQANDYGNRTYALNTTTFTYNELKAMVISPTTITWAALVPGATNQKSNNDPLIVNNTGNYNGTIKITGVDLQGETTPTEILGVGNFTAADNDTDVCSAGTTLVHNSQITITGTNSNPGNLSSSGGTEEIYYCIATVPAISSQVYSTTGGGPWTIAF